jgi:putative membrane protein
MISSLLILVIAALHAYFLTLEMFLWRSPTARRAFGTTPEFADQSATLAANQGLYNGFLVAGLVWGVVTGNAEFKVFFLICVVVAGSYGALTVTRRILYIQALPAVIALIFYWLHL